MFKNFIDILTSPDEAFRDIREKPTALVPIVLIILAMASLQWGYFNAVDEDFLIEELIAQAQSFVNVPEDQLRANYENLSPNSIAIQSAISIAIILPLIMTLYAGYLSLISKFTYDEIGFKQWFALSAWTSIPTLFIALSGWVVILANSDGMISNQAIQPLSLNNLIFRAEGSWAAMLTQMNLLMFWSFFLSIVGYKQWTGKSLGKSVAIVVAPYVVIYGVWSIIILV